jgi:hypothetical protein
MVNEQERPAPRPDAHTGARYVVKSDGAPPLPPPGGYRGARRVPAPGAAPIPPPPRAPRPRPGLLGWIALGASGLFALALVLAFALGATDALYGATFLAFQLLVVGLVVAALVTARGRTLGAWSLALVLLINVGTVGALSATRTSAEGGYAGTRTEEERFLEEHPGVKGERLEDTLGRPSLEEVRATADALSAEIRDRLTAEYGYTWADPLPEDLRPERNGYGGESMLVRFGSEVSATNEPIRGHDRKLAVMRTIDDVLASHDWWGMIAFNDPDQGLDPSILEKFYGSADPRTQVTWEWYSESPDGLVAVYATMTDLSHDATGEWRTTRDADHARTGEPLEGLQIMFYAERLLSEADEDEFERRMSEYELLPGG